MAKRYHITPAGEPGFCRAQETDRCPFGSETEHRATPEAARSAYEAAMAAEAVPPPQAYRPKLPDVFYHVTLAENVESIRAQGLLPSIGERSEEIGETAERVYLFDARESAYDALSGWLGDAFEEEELVLLSVPATAVQEPTPSFPADETSFEWTSTSSVPGERFTVEPDIL